MNPISEKIEKFLSEVGGPVKDYVGNEKKSLKPYSLPHQVSNKLSPEEYQKSKNYKDFNKAEWKWNPESQLYHRN